MTKHFSSPSLPEVMGAADTFIPATSLRKIVGRGLGEDSSDPEWRLTCWDTGALWLATKLSSRAPQLRDDEIAVVLRLLEHETELPGLLEALWNRWDDESWEVTSFFVSIVDGKHVRLNNDEGLFDLWTGLHISADELPAAPPEELLVLDVPVIFVSRTKEMLKQREARQGAMNASTIHPADCGSPSPNQGGD